MATRFLWRSLNVKAMTSRVDLVEIQRLEGVLLPAEQPTQPSDHVGGPDAIANGPPRGFAGAVKIRRIGIQHPQAGAGIGDDARERLIDLVRDRRRQRSEARRPWPRSPVPIEPSPRASSETFGAAVTSWIAAMYSS